VKDRWGHPLKCDRGRLERPRTQEDGGEYAEREGEKKTSFQWEDFSRGSEGKSEGEGRIGRG